VVVVKQSLIIVPPILACKILIFENLLINTNKYILSLRNGGVCSQPNIGMYTCTCPCGFTGTRCEIRVSFCSSNTSYCQNGATCVENQPCAVSCICPRGYYGTTCNILKNVFIVLFFFSKIFLFSNLKF
jgi:hypothetical protein